MDFGNLKGLSNAAMIGATEGWVDPARERPLLEEIPEVAGFVNRLDQARNDLIGNQVSNEKTATEKKIKEMTDEATSLDLKHDRLARGIFTVIEGNTLLAEGDDAEKLAHIQQVLFPEGINIILRSYLEEAGQIQMAKGRLTSDDRELLLRVPYMGGNLLSAVDYWFATGEALGDLERERTQLAETAQSNAGATRSDLLNARNQWIRVVRAILAGLELSEKAGENTMAKILQPLKAAVAKLGNKSSAQDSPAATEA